MTYVYRTAEKSDCDRIVKFLLEHFLFEEPCIRAMQSKTEEWAPLFRKQTEDSLKTPFSTIVTTESGDVVAVLLNSVWRRDDEATDEHADLSHMSEKVQKLISVLVQCPSDFWSLAPKDVNVVLFREISNVGKPWQRQGIATRMVTERLKEAKEFGVEGIVSATSSFANQTLLAKRGFKCLKEYPHDSVLNPDGTRILETDDGSTGLLLNFKRIDEFDEIL